MLVAHGTVDINKPIDEVFDYLADMRNEPDWLPGAADVTLTSPEPVGPGSTFVGTYARAGRVDCGIRDYDRPDRLTIHGDAKTMSFDDVITLVTVGGRTRLSATMRTEPKGLFKLFAPMVGRVINRQFQSNWDRLKSALESR